MNRKTQITIETHSTTIIRTNGTTFSVHCGTCGRKVSAFACGEIAKALRLSTEELEVLRQAGEIHTIASHNKMVCANSLSEVLRRIKQ